MTPDTPGGGTRIIFIDDDADFRAAQTQALEIAGFAVRAFAEGVDALRILRADFEGVMVCDVRMPRMDGFAVYERAREIDPEIPFILLTGHGDVPMAVRALKDGVYDFLAKPFSIDDLISSLGRAAQTRKLVLENRRLRRLHEDHEPVHAALLGDSPPMVQLRRTLGQVADADMDILLVGDTGAGKESAARALHRASRRRGRPFVHIHCASLPEETFQADLFGVEARAQAGAYSGGRRMIGRLERAQRGFVFLDEVEALSPGQQAKLAGVVQSRELWPVGAEEPRPLDIRIVATALRDLQPAVHRGEFRSDLFYQLSAVSIRVPSLAERRSDIRLLFQNFLHSACLRLKRPVPHLSTLVLNHLENHSWPGNARELEHYAERVTLGIEDTGLQAGAEHLKLGLPERMALYEAEIIRDALTRCGGRANEAARSLGVPRKTFYDKLNRHGISLSPYRASSRTV